MKWANETAVASPRRGQAGIDAVWQAMDDCIERGLRMEGELPGGLRVKRRAKAIHEQLLAERGSNIAQPHTVNDWLSVYAMAVNEENAAGGVCRDLAHQRRGGGGARGPALLPRPLHRRDGRGAARLPADGLGHRRADQAQRVDLGRRGGLPGGGRVGLGHGGGGLCAALGGTQRADRERRRDRAGASPRHDLRSGGGLVQVPCIERNGLGAIKAVSAASLALRGDGTHFMPLDNCIEAMRQTGLDMSTKYKETSQGGLAVNLPEC
jgi:L-serine dehydratase